MSALIILNAQSTVTTSKEIITGINALLQLHWDHVVYVSSSDAPGHPDLLEPALSKEECINVYKGPSISTSAFKGMGVDGVQLETALKARGIMAVTVCGFTDVMETARDSSVAGFKTTIVMAESQISIMDKQMLWANCITVI